MYMYHECAWCQKRASDSIALELQMLVSHHVGAYSGRKRVLDPLELVSQMLASYCVGAGTSAWTLTTKESLQSHLF